MCENCPKPTRRTILSAATFVAAAQFLGVSIGPAGASGVPKTTLTPDAALAKLMEGNARFALSPELCEADMLSRRAEVAKGQAPWAVVLTCADSRLSPELIFGGRTLGELFVCRNAGNLADTDALGSIEYGTHHLGAPLVIVMGHSRCGAVAAACDVAEKGTVLPGHIAGMVQAIVPAATDLKGHAGDYVDAVVRENAKRAAHRIANDSEIVKELVAAGKVKVVAARYDLDTGAVEIIA